MSQVKVASQNPLGHQPRDHDGADQYRPETLEVNRHFLDGKNDPAQGRVEGRSQPRGGPGHDPGRSVGPGLEAAEKPANPVKDAGTDLDGRAFASGDRPSQAGEE